MISAIEEYSFTYSRKRKQDRDLEYGPRWPNKTYGQNGLESGRTWALPILGEARASNCKCTTRQHFCTSTCRSRYTATFLYSTHNCNLMETDKIVLNLRLVGWQLSLNSLSCSSRQINIHCPKSNELISKSSKIQLQSVVQLTCKARRWRYRS